MKFVLEKMKIKSCLFLPASYTGTVTTARTSSLFHMLGLLSQQHCIKGFG